MRHRVNPKYPTLFSIWDSSVLVQHIFSPLTAAALLPLHLQCESIRTVTGHYRLAQMMRFHCPTRPVSKTAFFQRACPCRLDLVFYCNCLIYPWIPKQITKNWTIFPVTSSLYQCQMFPQMNHQSACTRPLVSESVTRKAKGGHSRLLSLAVSNNVFKTLQMYPFSLSVIIYTCVYVFFQEGSLVINISHVFFIPHYFKQSQKIWK